MVFKMLAIHESANGLMYMGLFDGITVISARKMSFLQIKIRELCIGEHILCDIFDASSK